LREREARWAKERREFLQAQSEQRAKTSRQRKSIAEHWRRRDREVRTLRKAVRQRQQQLDQRQRALDRQQAHVASLQRHALERQLVIDQAWAEIRGEAPRAQLVRIRRQVHEQMAAQYAVNERALKRRKAEIQALAATLSRQQQALTVRRQRWQAWATARQQEMDEKRALLEKRLRAMEDRRRQWAREKRSGLGGPNDNGNDTP
jgi:hypothetical protein